MLMQLFPERLPCSIKKERKIDAHWKCFWMKNSRKSLLVHIFWVFNFLKFLYTISPNQYNLIIHFMILDFYFSFYFERIRFILLSKWKKKNRRAWNTYYEIYGMKGDTSVRSAWMCFLTWHFRKNIWKYLHKVVVGCKIINTYSASTDLIWLFHLTIWRE